MKFFSEIVVGLGLGVVPPLATPEAAPIPQKAKVPCICGQSDQCKCEEGKCPGGCPVEGKVGLWWFMATAYDDAVRSRDRTGRRVVILFTDPVGCVPCRELEAGALADPAVRRAMGDTVNVKADVRTAAGSQLASKFRVNSWPRVIVYDAKGDKLSELSGNVDAATLLKAITR